MDGDDVTPRAGDSKFSLREKVAIVTGASSGLGEAIARALSAEGAKVAIAGRRLDRLEGLAADLTGVAAFQCDVAKEEELQSLVARTRAALGPVDILVNNAGIAGESLAAQHDSRENLEAILAVNLVAPMRLSSMVYPDMRASGAGSIINIASISGIVGIGRLPQAGYVASKTGLVGLTRELALQWARDGVRVNAIAPGYFRTEMTEPMYAVPKLAEWVERNTPMGRPGDPSELTGAVLLLASAAGGFITGQTFVVDGGWTAR